MSDTEAGTISGAFGAYYAVRTPAGEAELIGQLRGRIRRQEKKYGDGQLRHPAMVGDHVVFTRDPTDPGRVSIDEILPRHNALCRASGQEVHALGANLDRAVLLVGLLFPTTPLRFVDRFLVSCHAGGVPAVLVFSKADLAEGETTREIVELYRELGYPVFALDLVHREPADAYGDLVALLSGGTSLFAGNSGTGKSTLLNQLLGEELQKTAEISHSSLKGKHTTTNPRLFPAPNGGRYIDTPGIKEWGVLHLTRQEIFAGFPELEPLAAECRFPTCEHKPGDRTCAVQRRIRECRSGDFAGPPRGERLDSLEAMLLSLDQPDRIRYGDYVKPTGRLRSPEDRF